MGSYTYFRCQVKLKKDTPIEVIDFLKKILIDKDLGTDNALFNSDDVPKPNFEHKFFENERWFFLFVSTNWSNLQGGNLTQVNDRWVIDIETEFKNKNEIEDFFDWIKEYVEGNSDKQYLGFSKSEDNYVSDFWVDCSKNPRVTLKTEQ